MCFSSQQTVNLPMSLVTNHSLSAKCDKLSFIIFFFYCSYQPHICFPCPHRPTTVCMVYATATRELVLECVQRSARESETCRVGGAFKFTASEKVSLNISGIRLMANKSIIASRHPMDLI